jgi:hypothetical protein
MYLFYPNGGKLKFQLAVFSNLDKKFRKIKVFSQANKNY